MSEITIHLDSAYVGLIFLIFTEILIIPYVVSSQIKSMDREVKHRLDDGQNIELDIKEYGPLKITNGIGLSKIIMLIFPAALILLMVASGELGISGRTIPTYSKQDTFVAGGYFSLDSILDDFDYLLEYERSPYTFVSKWADCIEFKNNDNIVIGHSVLVPYEVNDDELVMGDSICSSSEDVVITVLKSQCFDDSDDDESLGEYKFEYQVTSLGDLVYEIDGTRYGGVFERSKHQFGVSIWMGEAVLGECLGTTGGSGNIFWVETVSTITSKIEHHAIIDDSWRVVGKERWIVNHHERELGSHISQDSINVVIECERGCFEAIVEWILTEGFSANISNFFTYLTIWYEGLNWSEILNDSIHPECYRNPHTKSEDNPRDSNDLFDGSNSTNWIVSNLPFKTPECDEVFSQSYILDGGDENVTEISIWAICFIVLAFCFTFVYYFFSKSGGYDLLSYEGISKVCYMDSHPDGIWKKGGALPVRIFNGRVTSKT